MAAGLVGPHDGLTGLKLPAHLYGEAQLAPDLGEARIGAQGRQERALEMPWGGRMARCDQALEVLERLVRPPELGACDSYLQVRTRPRVLDMGRVPSIIGLPVSLHPALGVAR